MQHAHLIGIGGSGLSAIARVLVEEGYQVSGSDLEYSSYVSELEKLGVKVFISHAADQVDGADFVLRSSAIPDDNVEIMAAREASIPVYKRADFLGKLTEDRYCIAVAGTHGKTTTTAMVSWMLSELGQEPSYIIGGVSKNLGVNAHAGEGSTFVIEADEYDRMFLGLQPQIAIVTNIEHDHPDSFPSEKEFYSAFIDFVDRISGNGYLVICSDDEKALDLYDYVKRELDLQTITFGLEAHHENTLPDVCGRNLVRNDEGSYNFDASSGKEFLGTVALKVPGIHNVLNSLASLAVAKVLGLPCLEAASALSDYQGTERRFEIRGKISGITVIDDYAHHPTEIRATLEAARFRYPESELWAVWQPHTYSRTEVLFDQYLRAFDDADHVLVTEVFPSREQIRKDFSSLQVVQAMNHEDVVFLENNFQVVDHLLANLESGDVVIVLSAGDATQISKQLVENLSETANA
jgi:UDP-N-acetylmuramate--alanine ligase